MIGSIIGIGLANQLMAAAGFATSGVDWSQAKGVFRALLLGFVLSAVLLFVMKIVILNKTPTAGGDAAVRVAVLLLRQLTYRGA